MKRTLHSMITLVLVAIMLLSIGVTAYADDVELPTEKVWYDYDQPEAVAVPLYELEEENITIDGISVELDTDENYAYITLVDLAAVKLLRESADKLLELGLSLDQLYIKNGLILVKEDGLTADEIAALEEKIAELTDAAQVALSVGDTFTFGNGEEAAFHVEIGGFTTTPVRKTVSAPAAVPKAEPAPEPEPEPEPEPVVTPSPIATPTPEPETFRVAEGELFAPSSAAPYAEVTDRPEVTTLYITYGITNEVGKHQLIYDSYGTSTDAAENQDFAKTLNTSYIYLVKSETDTNSYYYSTGSGYYELDDWNGVSKQHGNEIQILEEVSTSDVDGTRNVERVENALGTTICISTTPDDTGLITTIKYEDVTPKYYRYDEATKKYVEDNVPTVSDTDRLPSQEEYNWNWSGNRVNDYTVFEPKDYLKIETSDDGTTVTAKVNNGLSLPGEAEAESEQTTSDTPAETAIAAADTAAASEAAPVAENALPTDTVTAPAAETATETTIPAAETAPATVAPAAEAAPATVAPATEPTTEATAPAAETATETTGE